SWPLSMRSCMRHARVREYIPAPRGSSSALEQSRFLTRSLTDHPLHNTGADADLTANLENAHAAAAKLTDAPFNARSHRTPTQPHALRPGPFKASVHPLPDHSTF